jgi:hypothetical protein
LITRLYLTAPQPQARKVDFLNAFENTLAKWQEEPANLPKCTCAGVTRCIASIHSYDGVGAVDDLAAVMASARAGGFKATFITVGGRVGRVRMGSRASGRVVPEELFRDQCGGGQVVPWQDGKGRATLHMVQICYGLWGDLLKWGAAPKSYLNSLYIILNRVIPRCFWSVPFRTNRGLRAYHRQRFPFAGTGISRSL